MSRLTLLFLCVIVGTAACTGTSSTSSAPSPTAKVTTASSSAKTTAAVATSYYRAIVGQKYRQAFTYLAANATGPDGRRLTLRSFLQLADMMDGMGGPVTHFSVATLRSMVIMTLIRKKYGPYHTHLQMAQRAGNWTIISIDRI
jgi:hypothetical protein